MSSPLSEGDGSMFLLRYNNLGSIIIDLLIGTCTCDIGKVGGNNHLSRYVSLTYSGGGLGSSHG